MERVEGVTSEHAEDFEVSIIVPESYAVLQKKKYFFNRGKTIQL